MEELYGCGPVDMVKITNILDALPRLRGHVPSFGQAGGWHAERGDQQLAAYHKIHEVNWRLALPAAFKLVVLQAGSGHRRRRGAGHPAHLEIPPVTPVYQASTALPGHVGDHRHLDAEDGVLQEDQCCGLSQAGVVEFLKWLGLWSIILARLMEWLLLLVGCPLWQMDIDIDFGLGSFL